MEKEMSSGASSGYLYEVFLSFRGIDTRHGFTDCLYHSMVGAGILVFRDDESLRVGKKIGGELLQAIENSKIYIPIFSKNYASSHWCLRELAFMVECTSKSNENKEILPIFLDVEPEDVKLKTDLYSQALSKHQEKYSTEVESWKKALIEVDEIKGWNLKKDQGQGGLICSIIQTLAVKVKLAYENVTEHLVGVEDRAEAVIKMLDLGFDNVRFLGIHGMGGVGKTTLAKVVFNTVSSSFDGCCFLGDIRESSKGNNGLVNLQKQMLSMFLGSHSTKEIYSVNDGLNFFKRGVLRHKKVLIVLDDVDEKKQLKCLAEKGNWFGSGSRIIITTRDQSVLMIEGEATSEGSNVSTYEACEMEFHDALQLFSRHAFRRDSPQDHYDSLSKEVVSTLGALPLALEITGSSLNGKSKALWIDTLEKLKEAPPMEVQRKLMITYERLDHTQREVFLDIACFFVDWRKTYPSYMWDVCGYHPHDALEVLILLSMIKIKDGNTIWMHDQVRDLGREIIRQENFKDPSERSRIWNPDEAWSILKRKEGNRKIEALSPKWWGSFQDMTRDEFANLQKLRFLEVAEVSLVGDFNNLLSSLRLLSWQSCPFEFAGTNFHPTNLVVLDLSYGQISEEWNGWNQIKVATKLKVLDLSYCRNLKRTPDLSTWVSLERLILKGCCKLVDIDPSIGKLKLLTSLNLDGCYGLRELPEEIGCLQALTEIVMPATIHELPKTFGNLQSLMTFHVPNRQISKLPYSIGGLVKIKRLDLSECTRLKELPYSIGKLQSLVKLNLSSTSIGHLPDSVCNLKQLKVLRMSYIKVMVKLPSAIGLMESLEELDAHKCDNLIGEIPEDIGRLSCLRILNLSYTRISGLPTTVSRLPSLQTLDLESCPELKQLPDLPPSLTCLRWASDTVAHVYEDMLFEPGSVTANPTCICTLSQLETLTLSCENVQFLPQLPSSLRVLELRRLATTRSPDFSNLKNLSILRFYSCSMLKFSGIHDAKLEVFHIENCKQINLDALFLLEMERLRSLKIIWCEFLPEVIDLSRMKNLQDVDLDRCELLVRIHGHEELRKLKKLGIRDCPNLRRVQGLHHLESLTPSPPGAPFPAGYTYFC